MDADVISIETSRSNMELLDAFVQFRYPNEIGPGVYDIHSPRVPTVGWMVDLLEKALKVLEPRQLWVNPDWWTQDPQMGRSQARLTEHGYRSQDTACQSESEGMILSTEQTPVCVQLWND